MEIRTKFNVGQKVYRLKYALIEAKKRIYGWYYVEDTIKAIYTRTQNFTKIIYVFNTSSMGIIECSGKDIFLTQKEAQKECDKRNGCK